MNNAFTLFIITIAFVFVFGSVSIIGNQSINTNDNLNSDSIANIRGLDSELYTNFEINATSGVITGTRIEDDRTPGISASTNEQQEFIEPRTNANDLENSYTNIKKIPNALVSGIWFVGSDDASFYVGLLVSVLAVNIALAFYLFWRTGRVDKTS